MVHSDTAHGQNSERAGNHWLNGGQNIAANDSLKNLKEEKKKEEAEEEEGLG